MHKHAKVGSIVRMVSTRLLNFVSSKLVIYQNGKAKVMHASMPSFVLFEKVVPNGSQTFGHTYWSFCEVSKSFVKGFTTNLFSKQSVILCGVEIFLLGY